jgi:hypothetical protein
MQAFENISAKQLQRQNEANRYAFLLDWSTRVGLVFLLPTFAYYVLGVNTPLVPLDRLPVLWILPLEDYLDSTRTPTGWHWIYLINKGDMLNLVGIGLLTGSSMLPLLGMVAVYLRQQDYAYACVSALIILVQILASSGILTVMH